MPCRCQDSCCVNEHNELGTWRRWRPSQVCENMIATPEGKCGVFPMLMEIGSQAVLAG